MQVDNKCSDNNKIDAIIQRSSVYKHVVYNEVIQINE